VKWFSGLDDASFMAKHTMQEWLKTVALDSLLGIISSFFKTTMIFRDFYSKVQSFKTASSLNSPNSLGF
jgi:hypothetical protein